MSNDYTSDFGSYDPSSNPYTIDGDFQEYLDEFDFAKYDLVDPLKGQNGKVRDYNQGWGDGLRRKDIPTIIAAHENAKATLRAAIFDALSAAWDAKVGAEAAVNSAMVDADARKYEADMNFFAVDKQAETDLAIAKLQFESEKMKWETEQKAIDEVDSVNAEANLLASKALQTEADAEMEEAEGKRDRYLYGRGSTGIFAGSYV